jgi:hypothetical protein
MLPYYRRGNLGLSYFKGPAVLLGSATFYRIQCWAQPDDRPGLARWRIPGLPISRWAPSDLIWYLVSRHEKTPWGPCLLLHACPIRDLVFPGVEPFEAKVENLDDMLEQDPK